MLKEKGIFDFSVQLRVVFDFLLKDVHLFSESLLPSDVIGCIRGNLGADVVLSLRSSTLVIGWSENQKLELSEKKKDVVVFRQYLLWNTNPTAFDVDNSTILHEHIQGCRH